MSSKEEIATAAFTVGCAFAIGFVMQSGEVAELRYGNSESATVLNTSTSYRSYPHFTVRDMAVVKDNDLLDLQQITLASAELTETEKADALLRSTDQKEDFPYELLTSVPECDLSARAVLGAEAMMTLMLTAPCYGEEKVFVSYADQNLSGELSPDGTFETVLVAAHADRHVRVSFANGESITALASASFEQ